MKHFGLSEASPAKTIRRAHAGQPAGCAPERVLRCCSGAEPEETVMPTLEELGIGFVPFSPLGLRFSTGKIDANTKFDASTDFSSGIGSTVQRGKS